MIFNAWAATNPRLKKQAHREAKITKPPVIPVSVTKEELKSMAAQAGWTIRELTFDELQRMSSSELRFHEIFNRANLDRAFKLEQDRRASKERVPLTRIRLAWSGHSTDEETEAAWKSGNEFALRTPLFPRTWEAATLMADYMKANDLDATRVESYVRAFRELKEQGKIAPVKPESADEFLQHHPELRDTRTPPLIAARHQREQNTAAHFANSAAATSEVGVTRVVDFPREQHGVPPQPDKMSFRKKVQAMSADEIQAECAVNPAFREALDSLKGTR